MKAYCIFDDFSSEHVHKLEEAGISVTVLEKGKARPNEDQMKEILENYEIIIIGTSQKISESMWENIATRRIIGTASVGTDHIRVPDNKKGLLTVLNTPTANAQSVAEYVIGAVLMCRKRLVEGDRLYASGLDNKKLIRKPEDIQASVVGLVGAGHISEKMIELLRPFGVKYLCYTRHPGHHTDLTEKYGVEFVSLIDLAERSNIISVNVPYDKTTENLINGEIISVMKDDCIFVSVSRAQVADIPVLIQKAEKNPCFYVCLDLDIMAECVGKSNGRNVLITPHIAGGTIETRKRMFAEVTDRILRKIKFLPPEMD